MSDRRILGLDLSLTRTGYAATYMVGAARYGVLVPGKLDGMTRLRWIRDRVLWLALHSGTVARLVVIEGYAYARANQAHQLGELGGIVRLALVEHGVTYIDVPPPTLKKFATGRGNAKKEEMLAAAIRKLGYAGADNNEADALWLREYGLQHGRKE